MYYKHSGHFSVIGLIIGAAIGSAAALLLGFFYAQGLVLISDERMAMLATVAFGGLLGVAAGYGFVWGKVRNQAVAAAVTSTISAFALYVSWAVWVTLTLESQNIETISWMKLVQRPGMLWGLICAINEDGTWSLGRDAAVTKGTALWAVWLVEAAIVIGCSLGIQIAILGLHAFCERCERWCSRGAKIVLALPQSLTQLKLELEANDLRSLESLGPASKGGDHLLVELDSCPQCRQLDTLSLTFTTIRKNRLGKATIRKKKVLAHLLIAPASAQVLRLLSEKAAMSAKMTKAKAKSVAAGKK
jgi:hypothetical protein